MTKQLTPNERESLSDLGLMRAGDFQAAGIPRSRIYELVRAGDIQRQARGLYILNGHSLSAEHVLAQVAKRVPNGVLCLLTALLFHKLTTQLPGEVWLALPEKARKPRLDYPRLRVTRFSGAAFSEGIEIHPIEGVEVKVYSPAKTVADCFKYRNKVGIDVAVEALRDFAKNFRGKATELAHFAQVCRVTRVMQPYLDSLS